MVLFQVSWVSAQGSLGIVWTRLTNHLSVCDVRTSSILMYETNNYKQTNKKQHTNRKQQTKHFWTWETNQKQLQTQHKLRSKHSPLSMVQPYTGLLVSHFLNSDMVADNHIFHLCIRKPNNMFKHVQNMVNLSIYLYVYIDINIISWD